MWINALELGEDRDFQTDICIAGAGAAGISLAMEFAGTGHRVILLESGGFDLQRATQSLYRGEIEGREYPPIESTKRRQFGGSTVVWFGRCRPLDDLDFESRSWVPDSGWPISRADLDPYYQRAGRYCQLASNDYQVENDFFQGKDLETKRFHFSPPTDFGEAYTDSLTSAGNIDVVLNASVVHLDLHQDGRRMEAATCRTLSGRSIRIQAKVFVLAASALENTRLLLASRDVHSNGIGNQHDLVGRYFMEHPHFFGAVAETLPMGMPAEFTKLDYELVQRDLVTVDAIGLKPEVMRRENLLNACAFLVSRPVHKTADLYHSRPVSEFLNLTETLSQSPRRSGELFKSSIHIMKNAGSIVRFAYSAARGRISRTRKYVLRLQCETSPFFESRVQLSAERDALGVPQLTVHWKMSGIDLESSNRFQKILNDGLRNAGMETRRIEHDPASDGWPVSMHPGKHHMGTTRMHQSEKHGVVDAECRVHGVSNLYVAGGSVFPTSGMANPTLTIVALAVRIADHIKRSISAA